MKKAPLEALAPYSSILLVLLQLQSSPAKKIQPCIHLGEFQPAHFPEPAMSGPSTRGNEEHTAVGRAPFSSNKYVRGHGTPTLTFPMAVQSHSDIKMASCTLNMSSQYEGITGGLLLCRSTAANRGRTPLTTWEGNGAPFLFFHKSIVDYQQCFITSNTIL